MLLTESRSQDLVYSPSQTEQGEWQASLTVFSDAPETRAQIEGDLGEAGFRLAGSGPLSAILDGGMSVLGDVVVVDCGEPDAAGMAALSRLDERVARSGARLVVATSSDALEPLFLCFERSPVHWLVDGARGDRLVALAEARLRLSARVRELSEDDRAVLERLASQVGAIAERLDRMGGARDHGDRTFSFESPRQGYHAEGTTDPLRRQRPPLPDPRMVRQLIARRQARAKFFPDAQFADPAWDMLLDLTAARAEHARVSVSSLCIASGVPATTALRWIGHLESAGLVERVADDIDKRRAFIALTDSAAEAMAAYFAEVDAQTPDAI